MKKSFLVLLGFLLLASSSAFAGSKTKQQWLYSLPKDGKIYMPNGEAISNSTDGQVDITDGTNTLFSIKDAGTTGDVTFYGKLTMTPVAQTGITTSSAVINTSNYMILTSSGGGVVNTAEAFISTATAVNPNGTRVILMGGSNTDSVTVSDSSVFALGAATRLLGLGDILEVIIYDGVWYEVGFTNN